MTNLASLKKPDIKISVKQTFGIETEMEIDAFSKKNEFVPKIDQDYKFDRDMFLTFKCLAGDTGDNIPGIKGIGPKRAEQLIKQYGDLFDNYNACPISSKYKFIQSLNENADRLLLNAELMDLVSYSEQALIEADMNLEDLSSKIQEYLNDTD